MMKIRVFVFLFTCVTVFAATSTTKEFDAAVKRVTEIRNAASVIDSPRLLMSKVLITNQDYQLIGSDMSSSIRNHPDIPEEDIGQACWFGAAKDFDLQNPVYNYHGTTVNGKEIVEAFMAALPKPEYRASPQEVAWHYVRVRQLRAQGVALEKRREVIKTEALRKPWEKR
jgi:limonene-1,2-epoxide hydrolase